jgi:hypothetical protein
VLHHRQYATRLDRRGGRRLLDDSQGWQWSGGAGHQLWLRTPHCVQNLLSGWLFMQQSLVQVHGIISQARHSKIVIVV